VSGDSSTTCCESCNQRFEFEIELSSMFFHQRLLRRSQFRFEIKREVDSRSNLGVVAEGGIMKFRIALLICISVLGVVCTAQKTKHSTPPGLVKFTTSFAGCTNGESIAEGFPSSCDALITIHNEKKNTDEKFKLFCRMQNVTCLRLRQNHTYYLEVVPDGQYEECGRPNKLIRCVRIPGPISCSPVNPYPVFLNAFAQRPPGARIAARRDSRTDKGASQVSYALGAGRVAGHR